MQQLLILISGNPRRRQYYWQLVERLLSECIFQRNRVTFDYQKLNFDIENLLSGFETHALAQQQAEELATLKAKLDNYGKDMQSVQEVLVNKEDQYKKIESELADATQRAVKAESELTSLKLKLELAQKSIQESKYAPSKAQPGPDTLNRTISESTTPVTSNPQETGNQSPQLATRIPKAPPLPPVGPAAPASIIFMLHFTYT
jgi:chromosome segregation ATPase